MKHGQVARKSLWRRFRRAVIVVVALGLSLVLILAAMILTAGWRALFPRKIGTAERLEMMPTAPMPLDAVVTIYWDDYQIPFIEAATDHDAAFALGLVHAHLRGGQLALLKRASQGRLAEMFGPVAADLDVAIQTLDLGYAADDIVATLPPQTRSWLEAFVKGVNHFQDHAAKRPPEFGLLGIGPEPFTLRDLITLGRLAGADVNWFALFALLPARETAAYPEIFERAVEVGANGSVSFTERRSLEELRRLLLGVSRSGSNSVVVCAEKSSHGAAMIANDPHLGIFVPNFWILAGLKSPSYHCVGMQIPGLPFFAIGRNPSLAWGGTNMRAASSDLYDVSHLPSDQVVEEPKTLSVRWWKDRQFSVRRTAYGPIMSDARLFPSGDGQLLALRWVGHQASDEMGAFLRANRAANIGEFAQAFRDYAVSGQNMLVADTDGNIALTLAVRLPRRRYQTPPDLVLDPYEESDQWDGFLEASDLPAAFNPAEGFIASANNKPTDHDPPIGFFFSESERVDRMRRLLQGTGRIDIDFLKRMLVDVYSEYAHGLAGRWIEMIEGYRLHESAPQLVEELMLWDGHYRVDSRGPVAFEMLTYHVGEQVLTGARGAAVYRNWSYVAHYLADDMWSLPEADRRQILDSALVRAQRDFADFDSWGQMHRMQVGYPLAWLPVLGSRFVYEDLPAAGSRETIMKTSHGLSAGRSYTNYGSQSRHISIMDDPDNNYFVLLGGNDGWLGSRNLTDQVSLWRRSGYIKLPLRLDSVRARCRYHMILSPSSSVEFITGSGCDSQ